MINKCVMRTYTLCVVLGDIFCLDSRFKKLRNIIDDILSDHASSRLNITKILNRRLPCHCVTISFHEVTKEDLS